MGDGSKIHWLYDGTRGSATWNPMSGCSRISSGCNNCYAEKMAKRLKAMGQERYKNGFEVTCHGDNEALMTQPIRWKKPRRIFVSSMGDLFHPTVPFSFIDRVYDVMLRSPQHIFQVLTKRPTVMYSFLTQLRLKGVAAPSNIWHGVSVEDDDSASRIAFLQDCPVEHRFVSFEPLLGLIAGVNLSGIEWAIVGGESGPGAREMKEVWAESVVYDAARQGCSIFVKQMGTVWAKNNGSKSRKGDIMEEWPVWARIREYPKEREA